MKRSRLALVAFAALRAAGQGTADDGLTDSTDAIQKVLDTGRLHLAGDPLGSGAKVTALVAGGQVTAFRVDAPGQRYCKPPSIHLKGGASGAADVDGACRLTAVRVTEPGSGYDTAPEVFVTPRPRCYKVRRLRIPNGGVLEGDGRSTCFIAADAAEPVLFSEGAYGFHLRDFAVEGRGAGKVGMQFNGGKIFDAGLCTLENIDVGDFQEKNIELHQTFGFVLKNVHSHGGGWGLYLRDGFNNATQIISGGYSWNKTGGVYVGSHSVQFRFSSIAEGNGRYGILYRGPSHNIVIDDAYFEANGAEGKGWDVRGEFHDYDWPTRGITIRNSLFNSLHTEGAALIENTVDIDFSHNTGMPPMFGDAAKVNVVRIGKGGANPHFDGNTGLAFRSASGSPIHSRLPPGSVNHLRWSLPATMRLAPASGAANITTIARSVPVPAGHMVGAGAWVRTDSGTATAWVEIANGDTIYTGTDINQPHRQTIGPEWQWISMNVGTDIEAASKATRVALRVYRNDGSPTRLIHVRSAAAWRDIARF